MPRVVFPLLKIAFLLKWVFFGRVLNCVGLSTSLVFVTGLVSSDRTILWGFKGIIGFWDIADVMVEGKGG